MNMRDQYHPPRRPWLLLATEDPDSDIQNVKRYATLLDAANAYAQTMIRAATGGDVAEYVAVSFDDGLRRQR